MVVACDGTAPRRRVRARARSDIQEEDRPRAYCLIREWDSIQSILAARRKMIARLDRLRDMLEDLGGGPGVTDPCIRRGGPRNIATVLGLHSGDGPSIDRRS